MLRLSRTLAAAAGVLVLAGCASDEPPGKGGGDQGPMRMGRGHGPDGGPPDGPDGPGGPHGRAMLFISPSGEPFRAGPGEPYPVAAWFAKADANHDGQLDKAEFIADATRFFDRLDRNGDGDIDSDELHAYEHEMVPEISAGGGPGPEAARGSRGRVWQVAELELIQGPGGMGGGMGGMGGGGGGPGGGGGHPDGPPSAPQGSGPDANYQMMGAAPYNLLSEPEPVAASDLSFTGRISLADFKRRAAQRFDLLDPDGRGYLTLDTLPQTVAQRMGPGPGHGRGRRPPPPQA